MSRSVSPRSPSVPETRPPRLSSNVRERFDDGYERFGHRWYGGDGGLDAAVTFLMPPFAQSPAPGVVDAWSRYQSDASRSAGGLAPGCAMEAGRDLVDARDRPGRLHGFDERQT
jgi:hypothetical protein